MGVLLYTIKRSLAKLNIKHRMCCDKSIDYKMLTKFFLDIMLHGEGGSSHILAYRMCIFMALSFGWEIKILGLFLASN